MRLERLPEGGVEITLNRLDSFDNLLGSIKLSLVREETNERTYEFFLTLESDSQRTGKDFRFIGEEELANALFELFVKKD